MGGAPTPPSNPDSGKTNKNHFSFLKRQAGIADGDFDAAISSGIITIWNSPDYASKWGFNVTPPVQAHVEKRDDGSYDVTFLLSQMKAMNPHLFYYAHGQGQDTINYDGPVEDQTEVMTEEELQDAMVKPLAGGGGAPGGMPGMGGPPGAPGGAPPMGGAPGGAPPMGGMGGM